MLKYAFFVVLTTAAILLPVTPASASDGLAVSPAFQEVTVIAGQERQDFSIKITNNLPVSETLRLYENDFGAEGENGGIAFLGSGASTVDNRYGLASWISLEKDTLTLAPGESQNLKVSILNRSSLSPGGHYGAIIGDIEAPATAEGSPTVAVKEAIASLIFAKKTEGAVYNLTLDTIRLAARHWGIPQSIDLRFHNAGNVHVVPRGTVEIIDPAGTLIANGVINEDSTITLPESFRVLTTPLTRQHFAWRPGTYTVKVQYRFDGKLEYSTTTFPFSPTFWPYVLLALGLLLFVSALIVGVRHFRYKKKHGKSLAAQHRTRISNR